MDWNIDSQAWLPTAAWDLQSFIGNAKDFAESAGGGLLMLMGVVGLIWGAVLLIKKLMSGQQHGGAGWGQIVLLILAGGALSTGGWSLVKKIGSGGQDTIEKLGEGGGTIILQLQQLASLVTG